MLISCPKCSTKISDKAHACPHCGFQVDTLIKCPDCGQLVLPGSAACPSCGYPFPEETAQAAVSPASVPNTDANAGADTNLHATQSADRNHVSRGTKRVWYYEVHGFVYGPTSADDIYGRVVDGRLPSDAQAWRQGSPNWTAVTDNIFFSGEGPNTEDMAEQDVLADSNALPPMVSMDGITTYKYYPVSDDAPVVSPAQNPRESQESSNESSRGLSARSYRWVGVWAIVIGAIFAYTKLPLLFQSGPSTSFGFNFGYKSVGFLSFAVWLALGTAILFVGVDLARLLSWIVWFWWLIMAILTWSAGTLEILIWLVLMLSFGLAVLTFLLVTRHRPIISERTEPRRTVKGSDDSKC